MVLELVLVFLNISEILTKDAVQNVSSIRIAHQTKPALEIIVKTLARELAVKIPTVKLLTTYPHAIAYLDTPVIHSVIVMYLKNVRAIY